MESLSEGRQCPCTDIILAVDKFSDRVNLSAWSKATGPSIQISPNLQLTATLLNKFWGTYIYIYIFLNTKNIFH